MKYYVLAAPLGLALVTAAFVVGTSVGPVPAGRPAMVQSKTVSAPGEALEMAPALLPLPLPSPIGQGVGATAAGQQEAAGNGTAPDPGPRASGNVPSPKAGTKKGPFVVVVDAGHGSRFNYGAVYNFGKGVSLEERDLALKISLRLAKLLDAEGYKAVLTRTANAPVNAKEDDLNGDGRVDNADELQARVDLANAARADLFLSIHFNGNLNRQMRGTETYYCEDRPFAAQSLRFAGLVQQHVVDALRAAGKEPKDLGVKDDQLAGSGPGHLVVLGPGRPPQGQAGAMPAALSEALFLSSDLESTWMIEPEMIDVLANAYLKAIIAYFQPAA
ncbi:MAG: N-acetylmuramoyl-L-alanine amidase [Chloroflexi bacterium]|nr:N-acetylmuramoyl-L-alanine amidase [Chloroflexota bacterium]